MYKTQGRLKFDVQTASVIAYRNERFKRIQAARCRRFRIGCARVGCGLLDCRRLGGRSGLSGRLIGALDRARINADGHEGVCVSHQLPVETLRRAMNSDPLHHFPTKRMCNLASVTSFYFDGDAYVGWGYAELAGR